MAQAKILLKAPDGVAGASWGGNWYEVVAGLLEGPAAAVPELTRPIHGFVVEQDARAADPPKVRKLRG